MSSSSLLAIGLLCGAACNQVFGIDPTTAKPLIDAQYFDAPLDAAFECPPIGTTPRFSPLLHQPILQMCFEYTLDTTGRAIASCAAGITEGVQDAPLSLTTNIFDAAASLVYPRVSPEGDDVFVVRLFGRSTPGEIDHYKRDAGAWTPAAPVTTNFTLQPGVRIGTPSAGPVRRMMVINYDVLYELSFGADGVATVVDQYTTAALGLTSIADEPNLTPDGLRLTMSAIAEGDTIARAVFTDRATLGERFRRADPIDAFAYAGDPFMTADCARIYFGAVSSVLYVQRE